MYLNDLIKHIIPDHLQYPKIEINGISIDSRTVGDGDIFIAIPGTQKDGHDFISKAISPSSLA